MFPRSRWLALWSICLLWPCAGWAADAKTLDERFRQVEKMSQLERDRLQRNLTEFKKLTPEQQTHYRDLHDKVEQSTGHLSSLLQEYSAWLTTLTPSQRDELSKETDPAKKLALVRQFKEEQEYRTEPSPNEPHETPLPDMRGIRQRIPFGAPVLPPPELAAVMKVIAKDAGLDREKPNKEPLPKYYRELIKASIDKTPGGPRDWPSPDLQRDIEQALNRSDFRNMVNRRPEMKREMMIRVILGSISNLLFEELKSSFPSEQDFEKVFESLDREQQEAINRMPREERHRHLTTLHFKSRGDNAPLQIQEFRRHIDRLLNELGLPPFQPPPFGGDGSRPGPGLGGPRRPQEGRPFGPEGGRPGDPPRGRNDQERPRGRPND
ncbi:MAG: hypothetical protein H7062_00290 [Candidatus Saccharimonas sp.]|nr:hypothetical protein [Planctomycetaceae bacterium]